VIYDNPQAFVLCHYKRAQALCHRDGVRDTPTLDRCVPGCGNIIRTDEHAVQLRERAGFLDNRTTVAARPIGDRLRANAARLATWPTSTTAPASLSRTPHGPEPRRTRT
jgi:hypothetical protein